MTLSFSRVLYVKGDVSDETAAREYLAGIARFFGKKLCCTLTVEGYDAEDPKDFALNTESGSTVGLLDAETGVLVLGPAAVEARRPVEYSLSL
jgi:hypothetical protein